MTFQGGAAATGVELRLPCPPMFGRRTPDRDVGPPEVSIRRWFRDGGFAADSSRCHGRAGCARRPHLHGQASGGTCTGCHGLNAKGTPLGPDLTSGKWLWGGDLAAISRVISDGVPSPKEYRGVMPPLGGAQLSPSDVAAVAAYVWALGHRSGG